MNPKDKRHLVKRKGKWWVQIAVPIAAQAIIGKKMLREYLKTGDEEMAVIEKGQHVTRFKKAIKAALATGGSTRSAMEKALELRGQGISEESAIEIAMSMPEDKEYQKKYDAFKSPVLGKIMQSFDFVDTVMGRRTPLTYDLEAFIADYKGRAPHTVDTRRKDVKKLESWLDENDKEKTVEVITRPVAVQFKRDMHNRGAKRATVNKTLGSLRLYWSHMLDEGLVAGNNPWSGVSVLKVDAQETENPPIRAYNDEELLRILEAAAHDQDMHDGIMFAALTAGRRGELFSLKLEDLDRGMIFFKGTKNESSVRITPIHPLLLPIIERRSQGQRPGAYLLKDGLKGTRSKKPGDSYGKRFGRLKDKTLDNDKTLDFHSFRHWAATKMRYAHVADSIVSDILGHEHQNTTNRIYGSIMKKVRTITSPKMLSDEEVKRLREFLEPAIEAIKLPTAKGT